MIKLNSFDVDPIQFHAMESFMQTANIQCYRMFEWMKLTLLHTHTHIHTGNTWKIDLVYGNDKKLCKHLVPKSFNHERNIEFFSWTKCLALYAGCWTLSLHTATHDSRDKKESTYFKFHCFMFFFDLVWFCLVRSWIKHEFFMYQNMHFILELRT